MNDTNLLPSMDFLLLQLKLKRIWQQRGLGQHFLTDPEVLERIAASTGVDAQTLAVEIGPGPGTLTTLLAARAGGVLAVEYDERLRPVHADGFARAPQVKFVYGDALRVNLAAEGQAWAAERGLTRLVLTGNLPFQITSPLLFGQCGPAVPWQEITVMIQKEVADRIVSPPGHKAYGILSVKLAYWWKLRERFDVKADRFFPKPKVDASVLVLERRPASESPDPAQWPALSAFIDAALNQRRKMLVNVLVGNPHLNLTREQVLAALDQMEIGEQIRAEALSAEQFLELHTKLMAG
jgi:16S rRNA (adenine1518-N6/adenine1519-N6)-dimethyltransferase